MLASVNYLNVNIYDILKHTIHYLSDMNSRVFFLPLIQVHIKKKIKAMEWEEINSIQKIKIKKSLYSQYQPTSLKLGTILYLQS